MRGLEFTGVFLLRLFWWRVTTYPFVNRKLTAVLKHYIDNSDNPENHDILYKTFRTIDYLMKLIIRSRVQYAA